MAEDNGADKKPETPKKSGFSKNESMIGVGLALGVALGAAFDNIGLGISLGLCFGAAAGYGRDKLKGNEAGKAGPDDSL